MPENDGPESLNLLPITRHPEALKQTTILVSPKDMDPIQVLSYMICFVHIKNMTVFQFQYHDPIQNPMPMLNTTLLGGSGEPLATFGWASSPTHKSPQPGLGKVIGLIVPKNSQ